MSPQLICGQYSSIKKANEQQKPFLQKPVGSQPEVASELHSKAHQWQQYMHDAASMLMHMFYLRV